MGQPVVQELFAVQAAIQPDAFAVVAPDGRLTYGELDARADRLAERLRRMGVREERLVGLIADRSAAFVVGALGILKAGGAYVPLEPDGPGERLGFMLRDSGVTLLVTDRDWPDGLDEAVTPVAANAEDEPPRARGEPSARRRIGSDSSLAYLIYTSGSTGTPKGVLVEHRSLSNLIRWHLAGFGVTAEDRATLIASTAFDAAVWELWPYLACGASLHVPTDEQRTNPAKLRDWLVAERITISFAPTELAQALVELEWPAQTPLRY